MMTTIFRHLVCSITFQNGKWQWISSSSNFHYRYCLSACMYVCVQEWIKLICWSEKSSSSSCHIASLKHQTQFHYSKISSQFSYASFVFSLSISFSIFAPIKTIYIFARILEILFVELHYRIGIRRIILRDDI